MTTTLRLATEGKLATLTLTRAEKRNSICHALIDEFLAALQEVEHSPVQVLIVRAEGKVFSAGMDLEDLKALAAHTAEENHAHSERIAELFRSLYEFPKTTIAAVQGAAIAGGAALATLCDFTVASTAASFGYTEVRIGFVPAIVSAFLIRQVGEKHVRDLLLTGRIFSAEEAYRMGLVNRCWRILRHRCGRRRLCCGCTRERRWRMTSASGWKPTPGCARPPISPRACAAFWSGASRSGASRPGCVGSSRRRTQKQEQLPHTSPAARLEWGTRPRMTRA
jgi:enoyl-CoA hydratase/carnithine racemase